jgi:hypothetical protein
MAFASFMSNPHRRRRPDHSMEFWFFFSKKNRLLALVIQPDLNPL